MGEHNRLTDWKKIIAELVENSVSIAVGIFTTEGNLLDANDVMCVFLDTDKQKLNPVNFFVNPTFSRLAVNINNGIIFDGLLTIGNYNETSYVLNSKIYKKEDTLLVVAEVDVKNLFNENRKMTQLNQEVNNLQRQLIKEKKKLELALSELKETQQLLIHSEKMNAMGQLVAGVAHELNNPISFVNSNIYTLENYTGEIIESYKKIETAVKKTADEKVINLVKEIREKDEFEYLSGDIGEIIRESKMGIERVKKIVEDLRKFSRLDESEIKHIDLVENIRSTLSIVRSEMEKKKIHFEFKAIQKLGVDCFPGQLNQAILNVIINAIYAVNEGGKIILSVSEAKNYITISVKDDGCGIAQNNLDKIFNPFFTTKPIGTGTGLGLSITYKIIHDLHRGQVLVRSELNKGTEVFFEIPKEINA